MVRLTFSRVPFFIYLFELAIINILFVTFFSENDAPFSFLHSSSLFIYLLKSFDKLIGTKLHNTYYVDASYLHNCIFRQNVRSFI